MPTPPVLDIDALTAPIPGDEPAGSSVALPLREVLDLARKEIDPSQYDESDPGRPTETKFAEWGRIIEITTETLTESSKDLMMVARLAEALTRQHGFAGLRDSFRLFKALVDDAWDRLRPVIEEPDDLEARAAAFNWLDDPTRGARFPFTVRLVPLVASPEGSASWMDWSLARSGKGRLKPEDFEKIVAAATRESCQAAFDDIEETIEAFQALFESLNARMGNLAPGLSMLRTAVFECRTLAKQILDQKPAEVVEDAAAEGGSTAADGGADTGQGGGKPMRNRAQVYQRLAEAADLLQQLEPHSPVPYLIRRAVALGDLPFPALVKALVADASVLHDLSRNLGIRELVEE